MLSLASLALVFNDVVLEHGVHQILLYDYITDITVNKL